MLECPHGNFAPLEVIELLPRPCQSGRGRHMCTVCAYTHGRDQGLGVEHYDGAAESCAQAHAVAPVDMLSTLKEWQGGPQRHCCAYRAYDLGKAAGVALAEQGLTPALTDVEAAIVEEDEQVAQILSDENLAETDKEQLILARRGQGRFRADVLAIAEQCRLTAVNDARFLRASHIKPWRACTHEERLDGYNGLMLAPHVDLLFDKGFISFRDDGRLLLSGELDADILKTWGVSAKACSPPLDVRHKPYMHYHRTEVFKN